MDKTSLKKKIKYSLRFLPDRAYVKLYYRLNVKRKLDLKNPKTFNEKSEKN